MKRFLPVVLALSFSAIAVALTMFVFRPRIQLFRDVAGELRHKLDEAIEDGIEGKEADE
jgi:hypothetical protein